MFRLLAALLVGGALWLGYGWISRDVSTSPGDQLDEMSIQGVEVEKISTSTPGSGPPPPLQASARPPATDALVSRLESGDMTAAWDALSAPDRSAGERLAQALDAAFEKATPAAAISLLGDHNSFLHSEEGRQAARRAIAKARRQDPEAGVMTLTRFLQLCMKGSIEKADTAARSVVEEGYAALKPLLLRTVLDPADLSRAKSYKVQPGDTLEGIAKRFRKAGHKLESGTLAAFNRISDPRRLRSGQVLKVPVDPISTVVEKNSFLQAVYVGDVIFRLYWVAHGKDGCTPETTFTVGAKKEHPDWYADGRVIPYGHPDNVLGDYFIKFLHDSYTGFGVHGTSDPASIGTMASAGCIRMFDADIEDYFKVVPRGTRVEIRASR